MPTSTETPDPLAGAPEGATGKDSKGNYIKEVTENGYEYGYVYNAELGQWVREVANFSLLDYPYWNLLPYKILITENTPGERNLYQIIHADDTPGGAGESVTGSTQPTPIKATLMPKLLNRYFQDDRQSLSSNIKQDKLSDEMQGIGETGHEQAFMPIILSNGEDAQVKLSADTGIILTIMDKETLLELGGDLVSTWYMVGGITEYYSEVYGVDEAGNMLVRFAVDGSISDLSDKDLRNALLSFPSNFAEHKDQREQGVSAFGQALATVSAQVQPDTTTQDLQIERVPQVQR